MYWLTQRNTKCAHDRLPPKGKCSESRDVVNFGKQIILSRKRCKIETKLQWKTDTKSYVAYRMASLPVTYCKFCISLHCQASQTEISKGDSTKLCQTVDGRSRKQSTVEQLGSSFPKNWGPQNFYICSVFRRLWDLMANICWMKRDIHNRARALEITKGLYIVPKFHELWSTNALKPDRSFCSPSLFCSISVHRTLSMRH